MSFPYNLLSNGNPNGRNAAVIMYCSLLLYWRKTWKGLEGATIAFLVN
jgi:hypothetical protein